MIAAEYLLKEEVRGVHVEGLFKGIVRDDKLYHPLVYGYKSGTKLSYSYVAGWKHFPVWEEMDQIEWIRNAPLNILERSYVLSPPILRDEARLEVVKNQIVAAEQKISLDKLSHPCKNGFCEICWPQNTKSCYRMCCRPCSFVDICHGSVVDPLASGQFKIREPHHECEKEEDI